MFDDLAPTETEYQSGNANYGPTHAELVSLPIRDHEMSARTIEVQTLAGRTLPKGVADFLEDLYIALA
ncbi:hypothetical protein ACT3TQ_00820 [Halomonas sp. AOP12-C2-37]|uniref:Uncharacterized protein n=1 Tax=Halomonas casei TaxID=2742613 RepID=A0ABR9F100_9GAMM|nr:MULTISPECIES: hypothetical protein [Halomonas]MBE0399814.1 hypothetical protein [Halomonas casei]PCC23626.1 hypothetical protein CIK78_17080 [Halomonas sp. JB37]